MSSEFDNKKIREIIELVIDNRGKNPNEYSSAGIPVIDNYLITSNGEVNLNEVNRFIDEKTYNSFLRKYIQFGDVLMTLVGNGYGKVAITPKEKCAIIQNTVGFRCNNDNSNKFLYYLLRNNREIFMNLNRGAAQPSIKVGDILDLDFQFPSKENQERIASILGVLDDRIALLRETNATLEAIAQALFKSWFVDFDPVHAKQQGIAPEGMDETTAALFPDGFEESVLGLVPRGWKHSTVEQSFILTMGQSPPGDTYNSLAEGLPFYQGRTDFGLRFPTKRIFCNAPTRTAEVGDTLVSVRAPVGDVNMAIERCCLGRGVASVRHPLNYRSFAFYTIKGLRSKFDMYDSEGTVFGSINKKDFQALPVIEPMQEVLKAFDDVAAPLDDRIVENEEIMRTLTNLRDTLLPRLISGQLRLPETEAALDEAMA